MGIIQQTQDYLAKTFFKEAIGRALQEGVSAAGMVDSDDALYRQLSRADVKQMNPITYDKMLKIAYYLWQTNPGAFDVIEKIIDFTIGEGVTVKAEDPDVQEIIDGFWCHSVNGLDTVDRQETLVRDLCMNGELILPVAANEADGEVEIGFIDPQRVKSVKRNDENLLIVDSIILTGVGAEESRTHKVIGMDRNPLSPTFGRLTGDCFYFAINRVTNQLRGISDLLPLADWLDAYDQFLFNTVERSALLNAWVWDVTLDGMNETEIQDWLKKNKRPKPGSIRAHNQKVHWEAVSPELRAKDNTDAARLVRGQVHWGSAQPEHWAGFGDFANRATAAEMTDPPIKRLTRRQKYIRWMLAYMVRYQIDQAIIKRKLNPPVDPAERRQYLEFAVNMPEMSAKDTVKIAGALSQSMNAVMIAVQENLISRETSLQIFAALASQLGVKIPTELPDEVADTGTIDIYNQNKGKMPPGT